MKLPPKVKLFPSQVHLSINQNCKNFLFGYSWAKRSSHYSMTSLNALLEDGIISKLVFQFKTSDDILLNWTLSFVNELYCSSLKISVLNTLKKRWILYFHSAILEDCVSVTAAFVCVANRAFTQAGVGSALQWGTNSISEKMRPWHFFKPSPPEMA